MNGDRGARSTTYRATRAHLRLRGARAGRGQGQDRAARRSTARSRPRARFGSDVTRTHTTPLVGRELEKSLADRHLRARGAAALLPARDDRGRAGRGQEPPLRRALRLRRGSPWARPLAPGPLPSLRGGDRLLGARGDRQGRVRHPRVGLARGGGGEARAGPPAGRSRPRLAQGPPAAPRRRRRASPPRRRSRSPPGAGASRRWAADARRRSSSSRICTGRTTALLSFLEHLADWSEGVPLLLLCTARPELYEQHPTFGATARNAQRINLAPLTDEETARLFAALLERAVLPAETQRALLERAGGNPLYAEEFVRLLTDRGRAERAAGRGARLGAGADRRPAGHAVAGAQEPAPGRRRGGQGVLGGGAGGDGRPRPARGRAGPARALPQGARAPRPHVVDGGRGRVRLLARPGPRRLLRADPPRRLARRGTARPPPGSSARRASGRRTSPSVLAHHYVQALELAARRRADRGGAGAGGGRAAATSPWQESERSRSTSNARRPAWPRRSRSAPPSDPERASLLERWAHAAQQQGRLREARAALEEAIELYREHGDSVAAGRALAALMPVLCEPR